jgi:hypothetical protein
LIGLLQWLDFQISIEGRHCDGTFHSHHGHGLFRARPCRRGLFVELVEQHGGGRLDREFGRHRVRRRQRRVRRGSNLNTADCSSVPASRVNAALGTSVTGPTANTGGPAVMCQYAGGGNPSAVIIRIESNSTLDEMKAARKLGSDNGSPSTDVAGLGDAAYSSAISLPGLPTVTTVDAQKGGLNVQVSAAAPESTVQAFVAQLIG